MGILKMPLYAKTLVVRYLTSGILSTKWEIWLLKKTVQLFVAHPVYQSHSYEIFKLKKIKQKYEIFINAFFFY